jgi:hypothetical protein
MTQGNQTVCTSLCGFPSGAHCTPTMAKQPGWCDNGTLVQNEPPCVVSGNGSSINTCYGHSMLPIPPATGCLCYPNTVNNCVVDTSTNNSCQGPGSFSNCQ